MEEGGELRVARALEVAGDGEPVSERLRAGDASVRCGCGNDPDEADDEGEEEGDEPPAHWPVTLPDVWVIPLQPCKGLNAVASALLRRAREVLGPRSLAPAECVSHESRDLARRACDRDPGLLERLHLRLRRALIPRHDRTGVAHPLSRRRRAACDERDRG